MTPRRARPASGQVDVLALAAHVVKAILQGQGADQALSEAMQQHDQAHDARLSSQDRMAVGDVVFQVLRHWRLTQALVAPDDLDPSLAVLLQVLLADWPGEAKPGFRSRWASWAKERLRPHDAQNLPVYAERLQARSKLPLAIQYSVPDWLMQQAQADHPDLDERFWAALMQRAPVDLRVNLSACKRSQAQLALAESGVVAEPTPFSPWGLRLAQPTGVTQSPVFKKGWVEIQDEASQLLAALVGARRGQIVVDFCAGGGGKTLALGALMRGTGQL